MDYLRFRIISFVILFFINLFITILIIIKRKKKFDNISFDILLLTIFSLLFIIFSALYNILFYYHKIKLSLFSARMTWIGIFIISSYLLLALDLKFPHLNRKLKVIISFLPVSIIFLISISTSIVFKDFIIIKNVPVIVTGELDSIFRLIYFALLIPATIFFITELKKFYGYKKEQIKYFLYGSLIYVTGAIISAVILPLFINDLLIKDLLYDAIFIFELIWISFLAYAIVKYQLLDIETVFHQTLMWLLTSILILIPLIIIFSIFEKQLKKLSKNELIFFLFIIVYLFTAYKNFLQNIIDKIFLRKKYNKEKVFHKFISELSILSGMEDLISNIENVITKNLYSDKVKLFIFNSRDKEYKEYNSSRNKIYYYNDKFISFLSKSNNIIKKDTIEVDPKYLYIKRYLLKIFKQNKAEICVPFIVNYNLVGFMFLGKKVNLKNYTREDTEFLKMISGPISIAINNSITYNLAITDPLTGLYNRNFLFFMLEKEVARCKRYSVPLSLIFIDLDYLKRINDTYGHKTGDMCLQELSLTIKSILRDSDIAARYGGDEFVIILPDTHLEGAKKASERLLNFIRKIKIKINGKSIKFTVSIGITEYKQKFENYNHLLIYADKALYKAKFKGRNRIEYIKI